MTIQSSSRRRFLKLTGAIAGAGLAGLPSHVSEASMLGSCEPIQSSPQSDAIPPDYVLRIAASPIEIAPKNIVSAITYNGQFPGPLVRFAKPNGIAPEPDEVIEMTFTKRNAVDRGFNQWAINGTAFSSGDMNPAYHLQQGKHYRLRMRNASDDIHPIHLHRHSFELTKIAGVRASGVMKDVVMVGGYQEVEVDFVADNPGLTLFHCHQQLHMDFGFMTLFDYI